ncbi:uncharacterized protein HD556DRAFT_1443780 [Suillus plorans]|uniref:Uncharacterized protein n=1 Tax=Suillus plorans TaxID=116603 RepID=A0A9P7DHU5_9AGAM|nr:uncharacterized protein HD556DRAFT_1443780 [Suillus plorans]KAG1793346.1 hypothetical protein HD556DRAFT_1443780 [Suillus plorans]
MRPRGSRTGDQYLSTSHFIHVRPMFEMAWIPFLAELFSPLQTTDGLEIAYLCLYEFKNAIRIVYSFDVDLERNAHVSTLVKLTLFVEPIYLRDVFLWELISNANDTLDKRWFTAVTEKSMWDGVSPLNLTIKNREGMSGNAGRLDRL